MSFIFYFLQKIVQIFQIGFQLIILLRLFSELFTFTVKFQGSHRDVHIPSARTTLLSSSDPRCPCVGEG